MSEPAQSGFFIPRKT